MRTSSIPGAAILGAAVLLVLFPFVALVSAALQAPDTLAPSLVPPSPLRFDNFVTAWTRAGFGSLLASSAIIAIIVVPIVAVCATLAGYAFATMRVPMKPVLFVIFLAGLTLPYEAIIIPLYFNFRDYGLLNSYWAVILPLSAAFLPFGILWMRSFFESLPTGLLEAARIDGASDFKALISVLLPLAKPALSTLMLLDFMWSWNQFLLALILIRDPARRTAPSGLGTFVQQYGQEIPLLAAGTLIVILPVVVVYLIFQRQFISGLVEGALK